MRFFSRLPAHFPDVIALTAALAFTAGCGSSSSIATGPTPVKCGVTLAPAGGAIDSGGGTSAVTVATQPECAWTANAEAPWITELSPESGQGSGEVRFRVEANPAAAPRAGDVIVNGARARVDQAAAACRFTLGDLDGAFGAGSTSRTLTITTLTGCTWNVSTDVPWITLTPASGTGTGTITVTVAANGGGQRSGAVTVAGQTIAITQSGIAPTCEVNATPLAQTVAATGGIGAPIAIGTVAACAWTAVPSDSWIALTATSGTGPGVVTFTVTPNGGNARSGTIRINNATVTISQAGTSTCSATVAPLSQSIAAAGGAGVPISVSTSSGCQWSATSQVAWVTIVSGETGTGNGTVQYVVAANTGSERTGALSVAGQTFTITQAAAPALPPTSPAPPPPAPPPPPPSCSFAIAPTSHSATASGGAGPAVTVTTASSCAWTASSNATWIALTSGTAGTGNGSVEYMVAANTESARSGTLTVAGQTFTISQAAAAAAPCSYSVNPTTLSAPAAGGAVGPITVTTTASCLWTASSDAGWITVSPGGSGNGSVQVNVAANTGAARQGTLTIAGQAVTLSQAAACTFSLANSSQSIAATGGDGIAIGVTAPAGCAWTASSSASWLSITSGASGSGNGSVTFTAAANTGAARTGTMTIAGNTYTVMQAAGCSFAISPSSLPVSSTGGPGGPVSVTTTSGCTWTASSNVEWIAITSGASGSGNGSVSFNVAANTGAARTGTLTIAGETFTVSQAAASTCTYSVNPTSFSFERKKDDGTVTITTQAGCAWTASVASGGSFISLTSAASGTGSGTVSFSVAPNNGSTSRSGSLTIAGHIVAITQSEKD